MEASEFGPEEMTVAMSQTSDAKSVSQLRDQLAAAYIITEILDPRKCGDQSSFRR